MTARPDPSETSNVAKASTSGLNVYNLLSCGPCSVAEHEDSAQIGLWFLVVEWFMVSGLWSLSGLWFLVCGLWLLSVVDLTIFEGGDSKP